MNNKQALKTYWCGYRYAKYMVENYGYECASNEWRYGLHGQSYTYCKGFQKALAFYARKQREAIEKRKEAI